MIYANGSNAVIEILDGTFKNFTPKWTLNLKDNSGATIAVKGGSYDRFDPSAGDTEPAPNNPKNYLAEGYVSVANGDKFDVKPLADVAVAKIGDKYYRTLADAVAAAKEGDTIKLLTDVTIDTWNQVWNTKNLTIDGNNKTITVGKVESNGNGNYLFYGAENLNVSDLTINFETNGNGFSMVSGKLENVTVNGGTYAVATGIAPSGQHVEIKNCTFTGQKGMAIYTQENGKAEGTVIEGCTFEFVRAVILRNNEKFINNTVSAIMGVTIDDSATATVTGNTFTKTSRLKLYDTDSTISENKLLGNVVLDKTVPETNSKLSLNKNYWGENRTPADVLGENAIKVDGGNTNYYEADTMNPEDLNTYVPTYTGPSGYAVKTEVGAHGKLTVSSSYATKGTTVTVTVTPDKGYVLSDLTVTDKNGNALTLTDKGNGKYTFVMPDGAVTVKAAFGPESLPFTDVSVDAYYANAVKWAVDKGVTSGLTATTFGPNESCTRGQMVTFLWRAAGSPVVNYAMKFTDVPADAYYAEAVRWAVSKGITAGLTETTFGPEQTVTRGQVVAFLYRQAGSPAVGSKNPFTDVASDAYYADAVKWAVAQKITAGTTDTTFSPDADCTRGQIVTFLYNDMAK